MFPYLSRNEVSVLLEKLLDLVEDIPLRAFWITLTDTPLKNPYELAAALTEHLERSRMPTVDRDALHFEHISFHIKDGKIKPVFSSDWSHLEKPLALFMDSPDLQWANILENADDGGGVTRGIALIETINRTKKLPGVFPTVQAAIYVLPALIYADGGDEVKIPPIHV